MLRTRVIPCLQLLEENLVKTTRFKKPSYIGDFINTARIFNELEVDEMCVLGIRTTVEKKRPNLEILAQIANECFMPLSYGGGIDSFELGKEILSMGYEKLVINSSAYSSPELISQLAEHFGTQSIIASIDVKKNLWGKEMVYSHSGTKKQGMDPVDWAKELESLGAGELLITSIEQEGTWGGFDLGLIKNISKEVSVPVIAHGGGGSIEDIGNAVYEANASAVALGSMVVYQKKGMGVLVNFPDQKELIDTLKD